MSQIYKAVTSGSLPPDVPTSFVTDDGIAVPAAHVLNVFGEVDSGITTSGSGNTITINFAESGVSGTGTTIGATTADLITIDLGSINGTFTFDVKIAAYCSAGTDANKGNGYTITGAVRTTSSSATLLPDPAIDDFEEITDASVDLVVSGNNGIIRVTGVVGDTIKWKAVAEYTFVPFNL